MLDQLEDFLGGFITLIIVGAFAMLNGIEGTWLLGSHEFRILARYLLVIGGSIMTAFGIWYIAVYSQDSKKEKEQYKKANKKWFILVALIVFGFGIGCVYCDNKTKIENSLSEEPIIQTETTELTPTLTPKQQAEKIVRKYFELIKEKQYDEAYVLLDSDLQTHSNFLRPKWDDWVSTTTFIIPDDMDVSNNGNIYKVDFELFITPEKSTERSEPRTFCVTHNPQKEYWLIKSINDELVDCWQ